MAFTKQAILLLLALTVLAVFASPLQDISSTSVELATAENVTKEFADHLLVTVTRIDDLVDDSGSILAERIVAIRLDFEITDDILYLHGNELQTDGFVTVQIEAAIIASPEAIAASTDPSVSSDLSELASSFDIGLVTVEVQTTTESQVLEDGLSVRYITIMERVVEIDGMQVVETQARQQIIEALIDETGSVSHYEIIAVAQDPAESIIIPSELMPEQVEGLEGSAPCGNFEPPTAWESIKEWWMCLDPQERRVVSLLATLAGTLSLTLSLFVVRLRRFYCAKACGYQPVVTAVIVDEKYPMSMETEVTMESIEYDADEMDEKKPFLTVQ